MANKPERFCEQFETYQEMVDHVTQQVHSELLKNGGTGMRNALWLWLDQAIKIGQEIK